MENRTIKFRAWDRERKEMIAEGFHVIGEITMFGIIEQWIFEHEQMAVNPRSILDRLGDVQLMQYTGLKDKNGKEIYEGDLIRIKDHWDYGDCIKEVKFDLGSFSPPFADGDWALDIDRHQVEVIGNIYENPELLTPAI